MRIFDAQRCNCSWNYRFDSIDNHFNLVYPDDNAVYFGMNIPYGSSNITISSDEIKNKNMPLHPIAKYFSIQIYNMDDLVTSIYHFKDVDLLTENDMMIKNSKYKLTLELEPTNTYFALFRIYDSLLENPLLEQHFPRSYEDFAEKVVLLLRLKRKNNLPLFFASEPRLTPFLSFAEKVDKMETLNYWSGLPPKTYIDNREYLLCDIDYSQQGNIYTNTTSKISNDTGTVCIMNEMFLFMEAPPMSLMNADANYMIACIMPNTLYNIKFKVPKMMCSMGYKDNEPHPWINDKYDLRYASLSLVSTTAPRPTIYTIDIPCNVDEFTTKIYVNDSIPLPALLYRQLLPNKNFKHSIKSAKETCYDYVNSIYDVHCIEKKMGSYYPDIE